MIELIILTSSLILIGIVYLINKKYEDKIPFADKLKNKKYI